MISLTSNCRSVWCTHHVWHMAHGTLRVVSCILRLVDEVVAWDVCSSQLIDTQPSAIGGAFDEFVYSGRLDNQAKPWPRYGRDMFMSMSMCDST